MFRGSRQPNPADNCPLLMPKAMLLTIAMMLLHPKHLWRIVRDGE